MSLRDLDPSDMWYSELSELYSQEDTVSQYDKDLTPFLTQRLYPNDPYREDRQQAPATIDQLQGLMEKRKQFQKEIERIDQQIQQVKNQARSEAEAVLKFLDELDPKKIVPATPNENNSGRVIEE